MKKTSKTLAGDNLRDHAAELLRAKFGRAKTEKRVIGKKVDVYFETNSFGKVTRNFLEAKDYERNLTRKEVVEIWSDYSGIVQNGGPSLLLLVTRNGLSADAQAFVDDEQPLMRHQTILEIENDTLGLSAYNSTLEGEFDEAGLSAYYIDARVFPAGYNSKKERVISNQNLSLEEVAEKWLNDEDDYKPLAILGGYGAGKSSFAKKLVSSQAKRAALEPGARKPILIKLGTLTRYAGIEGLLGALFTSEHPLPSFNFRTFMTLNERGRLLIVLDGFDEMKHAMSWVEFRNQIKDLSRFVKGKAKVVLLGRPTAFLSMDEHVRVLHGVKKVGDAWRRDIDWPEFRELELASFDDDERKRFVIGYLGLKLRGESEDSRGKELRIAETLSIINGDAELFSKPVHLKILCDLACDKSVDIEKFAKNPSRWELYELFFEDLLQRELEKSARSEIDDKIRLQFLRDVAFWLWTKKAGQVSFSAYEIPKEIIASAGLEGEEASENLLREMLVGAFLEKKGGDVFYFGHRSFAEFLVAKRLVEIEPYGAEYADYSLVCTDGVRAFVEDYRSAGAFSKLAASFATARGEIMLDFVNFINGKVGGKRKFLQLIEEHKVPHGLISAAIFDENELDPHDNGEDNIIYRIYREMRSPDNDLFFSLLHFMLRVSKEDVLRGKIFAARISAAILERLFLGAEFDDRSRKSVVGASYEGARSLAAQVIGDVEHRADGPHISIDFERLFYLYSRKMSGEKLKIGIRREEVEFIVDSTRHIPLVDVFREMRWGGKSAAQAHFRGSGSLGDVFSTARTGKKKISSKSPPSRKRAT